MIGTDLNLDLPLLSDTLTTIVAKTSVALSAIEDSIADAATPAALNITEAMSFSGNSIYDVSSLVLENGAAVATPGAFYYSGNEFYLVDATSTIQVTLLGQLNSAAFGGIGGDYGGSNPALVSYDTATGQYRFYVNPATPVWATLSALDLVLNGTLGTVTFGVDPTLAGTNTFTVKTLPPTGVSFLVYNATGGTVEDGGVTTVTNPLVSSSSIQASAFKFSTGVTLNLPAGSAYDGSVGGGTPTNIAQRSALGVISGWAWNSDGNTQPKVFALRLPSGSHITGYGARVSKSTGTGVHIHVKLSKIDSSGTETNPDTANTGGIDYNVNNPGTVTITPTNVPATTAMDGTAQYSLLIWATGTSNDSFQSCFVTYDVP